ncbi:MAG: hypothetical protein MI919_19155 [Holophagales bacterium]|nr:hypothetical protein [Holophagales bacterium]
MTLRPEDLHRDPNALAPHYSRFRVAERLLLTGHSHQAWPDVARQAQLRAFDDAAEQVDRKWPRAFAAATEVKEGFARLLGDRAQNLALASSTHELLVRFLSSLPLRQRPRLLTTDGEFHSIRRQLQRLEEEGIEVARIGAADPTSLAERLAAAVDSRTAAVLVSSVLFQSGRIVPDLASVARAAEKHGSELLVDTYHHLGIVPFDLAAEGLESAFAVGGGYKYCQLGEGNCFLRVPPGRNPRPVITGWYAEFEELSNAPTGKVAYGAGAAAFSGATYDPTSHYRAAAVFAFFATMGLDAAFLRRVSQHQVRHLARGFDALDADPDLVRRPRVPLEELGGFLTLTTPRAADLSEALARRGVSADYRDEHLRLGPAPYLCDRQLEDATAALGEAIAELHTAA